jgi:hypothetical protein
MTTKIANNKTCRFIDEDSVEAVKVYLESGRARGATLRGIFLSLLVALLVSGCTAAYSPALLPTNHPASPAAPEAPPPPPSQAFRSEGAAPTEEAPLQGPHAKHGMLHGGH